jgi:hypothetical protein
MEVNYENFPFKSAGYKNAKHSYSDRKETSGVRPRAKTRAIKNRAPCGSAVFPEAANV